MVIEGEGGGVTETVSWILIKKKYKEVTIPYAFNIHGLE